MLPGTKLDLQDEFWYVHASAEEARCGESAARVEGRLQEGGQGRRRGIKSGRVGAGAQGDGGHHEQVRAHLDYVTQPCHIGHMTILSLFLKKGLGSLKTISHPHNTPPFRSPCTPS